MPSDIPTGRFAPSPTGPLHFGSLVAAVGSYLEARRQGGRWLVRIEDVDRPREVPRATDTILRQLEGLGFQWDGPVMYQSRRTEAYRDAFDRLWRLGVLYNCTCSRKTIAESAARAGTPPGIYPGTCRGTTAPVRERHAVRIDVQGTEVHFEDRLQGRFAERLEETSGDFVVLRADGLFAYQLAVVVDDAEQGVTDVVRGSDLLDSTGRQLHLQRLFGFPEPGYLHLPVAVDATGAKLSKQNLAPPVTLEEPARAVAAALCFLGHCPPGELAQGPLDELWKWALSAWTPVRLPRRHAILTPGSGVGSLTNATEERP